MVTQGIPRRFIVAPLIPKRIIVLHVIPRERPWNGTAATRMSATRDLARRHGGRPPLAPPGGNDDSCPRHSKTRQSPPCHSEARLNHPCHPAERPPAAQQQPGRQRRGISPCERVKTTAAQDPSPSAADAASGFGMTWIEEPPLVLHRPYHGRQGTPGRFMVAPLIRKRAVIAHVIPKRFIVAHVIPTPKRRPLNSSAIVRLSATRDLAIRHQADNGRARSFPSVGRRGRPRGAG